ncbi:phage holin family protein [Croceicoccus sp. F390]|uniref:Phage holin family protein n=1 Tax=Croceicoccus esteveae TaxID=3075597 RepID=A0ABU2ZET8_9SPHN|nr:phage holin family protein [Croceicoccus sp. F390]MDT0575113.1 phage holin family protein [Croceicoccus sp. F390]
MTDTFVPAGSRKTTIPLEPRIETTRTVPTDEALADRSLVEDAKALVQDGKLLAEAELDFQKKRASYAAGKAGGIAARFAAAGVIAFLAAIALTVGLVIALGQLITIWGSTALVTLVYLLIAYLLVRDGQKKLQHVKSVVTTEKR